jgi:hypothetical protein
MSTGVRLSLVFPPMVPLIPDILLINAMHVLLGSANIRNSLELGVLGLEFWRPAI